LWWVWFGIDFVSCLFTVKSSSSCDKSHEHSDSNSGTRKGSKNIIFVSQQLEAGKAPFDLLPSCPFCRNPGEACFGGTFSRRRFALHRLAISRLPHLVHMPAKAAASGDRGPLQTSLVY
jgi:hypothetical protein